MPVTLQRCPGWLVRLLFLLAVVLTLGACSHPRIQTPSDTTGVDARLDTGSVIMPDGYVLAMKQWMPTEEPTAIVLAVHGFNDYSNAFDAVGHAFADDRIKTYAIDQRGFGSTEQRGVWPGHRVMQSDLQTTIDLLCQQHDGLPLFLLGESMGGAVILSAAQQLASTCIRGVILSAPAVWGWQTMPWWQTLPLRFLAHTMPERTVTGENLDIEPSDNDEMLRALGRDPLIIKETRIDALYGLTDLMEAALVNGNALKMPSLLLYGEHDEIIPPEAFCMMLSDLPDPATIDWRLVLYANGYHMLSRDLQGGVVIRDMLAWIHDQHATLPSGEEIGQDLSRLSALDGCDDLRIFSRTRESTGH